MAFTYRNAVERLEEFFLRLRELSTEAATIHPAKAGPGPTDANGSPVEEPAEVTTEPAADSEQPRSGALHPKHITGI